MMPGCMKKVSWFVFLFLKALMPPIVTNANLWTTLNRSMVTVFFSIDCNCLVLLRRGPRFESFVKEPRFGTSLRVLNELVFSNRVLIMFRLWVFLALRICFKCSGCCSLPLESKSGLPHLFSPGCELRVSSIVYPWLN